MSIRSELQTKDVRVWDLHCDGFPMSRIARLTGRPLADVRGVITGVWYDQQMRANGRR